MVLCSCVLPWGVVSDVSPGPELYSSPRKVRFGDTSTVVCGLTSVTAVWPLISVTGSAGAGALWGQLGASACALGTAM